jgi:hypothetical protein
MSSSPASMSALAASVISSNAASAARSASVGSALDAPFLAAHTQRRADPLRGIT